MTEERSKLQFDDNTLVPMLFGEHDQNLARLEQQLGVSLASFGNQVTVSGPDDSREAAEQALEALYERLKRGLAVGDAAAIRGYAAGLEFPFPASDRFVDQEALPGLLKDAAQPGRNGRGVEMVVAVARDQVGAKPIDPRGQTLIPRTAELLIVAAGLGFAPKGVPNRNLVGV